jgi:hypothetical protein
MPIKNPKEVFVMLLSDVRHFLKNFRRVLRTVQDPGIKEALGLNPWSETRS